MLLSLCGHDCIAAFPLPWGMEAMTCLACKSAPLLQVRLRMRSAEIRCEEIVGALAPTLVDFAGSLENPLTVAIKALEQGSFAGRRLDRDADQGALIEEERDF